MRTYKIKIRSTAKTHLRGFIVVMARTQHHALEIVADAIPDATPGCFEAPIEYKKGVVYATTNSVWGNYR